MNVEITNTRQVTIRLKADSEGLVQSLLDELARLAQEAVRFMKQRAPKWRSQLANSITAREVGEGQWSFGPSVDYAQAVEEGSGPGHGLPRWASPDAADIKAWLTSKVFTGGRRRARKGSKKARAEDVELRDRYQGLSWHVFHHGVKAHPYAKPTLDMMERAFPARMELAARRHLATKGGAGGGSGGSAA